MPTDRTGALLFAEAKLRKGDSGGAVALLEPFAQNERDTAFLALFGEGLLRTGRLDRAREAFEAYYKQKPDSFAKLFELAGAYLRRGRRRQRRSTCSAKTKEWMRAGRKESELSAQMDRLAASYPASLPLAETVAHAYEEMNRETKYFDSLVSPFRFVSGRSAN